MAIIRIQVDDDSLKEKLLKLLNRFSSPKFQVITEDEQFNKEKKIAEEHLAQLDNPNTKFYSLDELEQVLNEELPFYGS